MSDPHPPELQPFLGGVEDQDTIGMSTFNTGVAFDLEKVEERQAEIDGIMAREYRNPTQRTRDLNKKIAGEWGDDFGISYARISGVTLPGLIINGVAEKIVLSANHMPNADFRGGQLNASVFTASSLPGLRANGANLNDTIFTLASMKDADLGDVSAVDVNFNFANLTGVEARGANLSSAFLIATQGLTKELFDGIADVTAARAMIQVAGGASPSEVLRDTLGGRFIGAEAQEVLNSLDPVRILRAIKLANALTDERRLEGVVLDDAILSGTRLTRREMTGSVWHNVHGRNMVLRGVKLAGSVVINTDLQNSDAAHLWAPGIFVANSSLRDTSMGRSNLGGAVLINVDLEDADVTGSNMDGVVMVGGKVPEIDPEVISRMRILEAHQLPAAVLKNVLRLGTLSVGVGRSTGRELQE